MQSLEKRVAALESNAVADRQYNETNYQAVVETCSNLFNMTTEDVTNWEHLALRVDLMTNLFALEGAAMEVQQVMNSNLETRLAALEKKTPTNRPAAPARASTPPRAPAPALRYGIPTGVFEAIAEKAAKDFPKRLRQAGLHHRRANHRLQKAPSVKSVKSAVGFLFALFCPFSRPFRCQENQFNACQLHRRPRCRMGLCKACFFLLAHPKGFWYKART